MILWRNIENYPFFHFDSDPRFSPFLLYVWWKTGVTFVRRCFRDANDTNNMTIMNNVESDKLGAKNQCIQRLRIREEFFGNEQFNKRYTKTLTKTAEADVVLIVTACFFFMSLLDLLFAISSALRHHRLVSIFRQFKRIWKTIQNDKLV